MQAALALGDWNGYPGSGDRRDQHRGELRPAACDHRDHPLLQASQAAAHARDDRAARGEGPAGSAGAAAAPGPDVRGVARRARPGGAGARAGALLHPGSRSLVDRAHPGPHRRGADRLVGDRIAPGQVGPSDADLILAVLDRDDREAFAELVRRHQSKIRTVLRRLTGGDIAFADDLAQDTFVLAWRNLRSFRFEARFSTWLYRIAFNAWQSEARKRRELLLDNVEEAADAHDAGFDELPDIASRVDLERAIATLSDGERAAIAACYYADLSHEEAAQALGMPVGT